MKKKKTTFKFIMLIVFLLVFILIVAGTCKRKVSALESAFAGDIYTLSAQSSSEYNFVCIYNLGYNAPNTSYDLLYIDGFDGSLKNYINVTAQNTLRVIEWPSYQMDNYNLSSRIIQCEIVYDSTFLYLIIYQISFSIQQITGVSPSVDGINRVMLTRYILTRTYDLTADWQNDNIKIIPMPQVYGANCLLNCSYISSGETPQDTNGWVDNQVLNYYNYNILLNNSYNTGYTEGYTEGYNTGEQDGEEVGFEIGYNDGYDEGYGDGTSAGYNTGYDAGYDTGYNTGYDEGQAGENATPIIFNVLSGVFQALGAFLSIELLPHLSIGLFFALPLFFAIVGLILWIWRRH